MIYMPELPEVEVIRLNLLRLIKGKKITHLKNLFPPSIAHPDPKSFSGKIKNTLIKDIERRGKFLIIHLNKDLRLVIHLRMTGSLVYYPKDKLPDPGKHCRLIIYLENGEGGALYYSDMRKFGRLWLINKKEETLTGMNRLGPDWLNVADPETFKLRMQKYPKAPVKRVLLDQRVMAGLGNIYVDESLFRAAIHPARTVNSLKDAEIERLYIVIREVLDEGIESGGTTIRDYKNADGSPGGFQNRIRIYGRKGAKCFNCNGTIHKTVMCGRGTYFCPSCQNECNML